MVTMVSTPVAVFTKSGEKMPLTLPERSRFVMLNRGHVPFLIPFDKPGEYLISADGISPAGVRNFPTIIVVIDCRHLDAFMRMPPDRVTYLVDQADTIASTADARVATKQ